VQFAPETRITSHAQQRTDKISADMSPITAR
jgi:hypothetical protein